MTCAIPDGFRIRMLRSGIEIELEELDFRNKRRDFVYAEARMSERAGRLLGKADKYEPGFILFDGFPAGRVFINDESISFTKSLDERTVADVEFLDPKYILDGGVIDKSYDRGEVDTASVIEDILNEREDPNNVITGYEIPDALDSDPSPDTEDLSDDEAFAIGISRSLDQAQDWIDGAVNNSLGRLLGEETNTNAVLTFDELTPLEAMQKFIDTGSMRWYVDLNGVVRVEVAGAVGNVIQLTDGKSVYPLERYTVTEPRHNVNSVTLRAPAGGGIIDRGQDLLQGGNRAGLQLIGEATTTAFDGTTKVVDVGKNITSPNEIEDAAARELHNILMSDTGGSMVINGLACPHKDVLAFLDVGDYVQIPDSIAERCKNDVATGLFLIESIHHQINPRQGWRVVVSLARTFPHGSLSTSSVFYDPETDKEYESLDAYNQEPQPELGGDDYPSGPMYGR